MVLLVMRMQFVANACLNCNKNVNNLTVFLEFFLLKVLKAWYAKYNVKNDLKNPMIFIRKTQMQILSYVPFHVNGNLFCSNVSAL